MLPQVYTSFTFISCSRHAVCNLGDMDCISFTRMTDHPLIKMFTICLFVIYGWYAVCFGLHTICLFQFHFCESKVKATGNLKWEISVWLKIKFTFDFAKWKELIWEHLQSFRFRNQKPLFKLYYFFRMESIIPIR